MAKMPNYNMFLLEKLYSISIMSNPIRNVSILQIKLVKCSTYCSYEMTIKITTASIKTRLFPYDRKILTWKPSKYDITIWNIIKINFDYVLIYYMFSYVFSISFACIFIRIILIAVTISNFKLLLNDPNIAYDHHFILKL